MCDIVKIRHAVVRDKEKYSLLVRDAFVSRNYFSIYGMAGKIWHSRCGKTVRMRRICLLLQAILDHCDKDTYDVAKRLKERVLSDVSEESDGSFSLLYSGMISSCERMATSRIGVSSD